MRLRVFRVDPQRFAEFPNGIAGFGRASARGHRVAQVVVRRRRFRIERERPAVFRDRFVEAAIFQIEIADRVVAQRIVGIFAHQLRVRGDVFAVRLAAEILSERRRFVRERTELWRGEPEDEPVAVTKQLPDAAGVELQGA